MGKRADTISKQVQQHGRIVDEATAALLDAEDALTAVEDRETRRATRRRNAAQFPGRVEV